MLLAGLMRVMVSFVAGLIYKDEFKDYIKTHQITKRAMFSDYLKEIER